jgi:hypothetical protein
MHSIPFPSLPSPHPRRMGGRRHSPPPPTVLPRAMGRPWRQPAEIRLHRAHACRAPLASTAPAGLHRAPPPRPWRRLGRREAWGGSPLMEGSAGKEAAEQRGRNFTRSSRRLPAALLTTAFTSTATHARRTSHRAPPPPTTVLGDLLSLSCSLAAPPTAHGPLPPGGTLGKRQGEAALLQLRPGGREEVKCFGGKLFWWSVWHSFTQNSL